MHVAPGRAIKSTTAYRQADLINHTQCSRLQLEKVMQDGAIEQLRYIINKPEAEYNELIKQSTKF